MQHVSLLSFCCLRRFIGFTRCFLASIRNEICKQRFHLKLSLSKQTKLKSANAVLDWIYFLVSFITFACPWNHVHLSIPTALFGNVLDRFGMNSTSELLLMLPNYCLEQNSSNRRKICFCKTMLINSSINKQLLNRRNR